MWEEKGVTTLHQKLMAIIKEAEKATQEPWFKHEYSSEITFHNGVFGERRIAQVDKSEDLEFLITSRTNVPRLAKALLLAIQRMERLTNVAIIDSTVIYFRNTLAEIEKEFE